MVSFWKFAFHSFLESNCSESHNLKVFICHLVKGECPTAYILKLWLIRVSFHFLTCKFFLTISGWYYENYSLSSLSRIEWSTFSDYNYYTSPPPTQIWGTIRTGLEKIEINWRDLSEREREWAMSVAGGGKRKHKFLRSLTCDLIPITAQPSQGTKVE